MTAVRVARLLRIVVAGASVLAMACACTHPLSKRPASPHPSRSVPTTQPPTQPTTQSTFAGLTLTHPTSWRAYLFYPGSGIDPDAEGFLTNQPIGSNCAITPGAIPRANCGEGEPVANMSNDGVYLTIEVLYQPFQGRPHAGQRLGDYSARVTSRTRAHSAGCRQTTTRTTVTAAPKTARTQPSAVWISATLCDLSSQTKQALTAMLATAHIASRPVVTTPVPRAPLCRSTDVSVTRGPRASEPSQGRSLIYAVRNDSAKTCHLEGYPSIRLWARAKELDFSYRDAIFTPHPPVRRLFLPPGSYAWFEIATTACSTGTATAARTAAITLPGQSTVTRLRAAPRGERDPGIAYSHAKAVNAVGISALTAR
ncbi:MAG TPA: DUF4232 domain-containing protein [Jatrophihabitantaceae bacterium]|jgi:hypothetical protein|nr:DUF4232 domain-containing protein [Jatrophihabitantaceae bacterium]